MKSNFLKTVLLLTLFSIVNFSYSIGKNETKQLNKNMRASILTIDVSSTNMNCNIVNLPGNCDGTITVSVTGGVAPYTYEIISLSNPITVSDDSYTFTEVCNGSYTVKVSDANFVDFNTTPNNFNVISVSISHPAPIDVVRMSTPTSCYEISNGEIDIFVTGGTPPYFYNWTGPNLFTSEDEDISGLEAGNYMITIADGNGCSSNTSVDIYSPDPIVITTDSIHNALCGNNDGFINISVSGGEMSYNYNWENDTSLGNIISTYQDIQNLTAGTYNLTVMDGNGCETSQSWTINAIPQVNISEIHINPSCYGENTGEINLSISCRTPPYTFNWENSENTGVNISTEQNLTNLLAGTYCVTITDSLLSTDSLCVTLTETEAITVINNIQDSYNNQNNGEISITVSGGTSPYIYNWETTSGSSLSQNEEQQDSLESGTYYLTITDNNNCLYTDSFIVNNTPEIIINQSIDSILCYNDNSGVINLSVSGGILPYSYLWNTNDNGQALSNLIAGTYCVTVSDSVGNNESVCFTLNNPLEITYTVENTPLVTCYNGNDAYIDLSVSGGTGIYTYDWSTGDQNQDITGLYEGDYYVTITDANNCETTGQINVSQPDSIEIYLDSFSEPTNGVCNGHISVTPLNGTEPYTYFWNDTEGTNTINNLCNDTYNLLVLDSNNCEATESYNLDLVFNNEDPNILDTIEMTVEACIFDFSLPLDSAIISGYDEINEDSIVLHWEFWQAGILVTYDLGITPSTIGDNLIMLEFVCESKEINATHIYRFYGVFTYGLTSKQSFEVLSLKIYPNPMNEIAIIELDNYKEVELSIFDIKGQLIKHSNYFNNETISINKRDFKAGTYLVKIKTDDNLILTKKLIIR